MTTFLLDRFRQQGTLDAFIWKNNAYRYDYLIRTIHDWQNWLDARSIEPGSVVALIADYSPKTIALLFSLIEHKCIIVPLTPSLLKKKPEFISIAQAEWVITLSGIEEVQIQRTGVNSNHVLIKSLKHKNKPGLILFSSGSSGMSKAALHDLECFLEKYKVPRLRFRTINFLLFDHIGGLDTLFYTLSNTGTLIFAHDRSPHHVCALVEQFKAQVLPVSPTFLNLLILSECYKQYDLSSLEIITYGAEVMPESTLRIINDIFPHVRMLQKYGLTEVGTLRSKSLSSQSIWLKVGGEGYQTRIIDGMLEIKSRSAMLGYLNAPSPFTEDGFFQTGDMVESDGEYIRILGRASELINVGGEKVLPAEIESVILSMDNVAEASVFGDRNTIVGQIICANVRLIRDEAPEQFIPKLKQYCRERLEKFKIPIKIYVVNHNQYSDRYKKVRPHDQ